jgi:hypothetical protein
VLGPPQLLKGGRQVLMGHKARATRLDIGKLLIELRSQLGRERLTKRSSPRRREGRVLVDGGSGRARGAHAPERTAPAWR